MDWAWGVSKYMAHWWRCPVQHEWWVMPWGSAQSLGFSMQSASTCTQPWGWFALLCARGSVFMLGFYPVHVLQPCAPEALLKALTDSGKGCFWTSC